ncbi:MAG TPA: heme lyase CcmF/NrfE family subunit [Gammaproteobacteria bacterium]|nr:heme lyase CcmF/NrfE family subunit [Gammaproteobacteria bacterium]
MVPELGQFALMLALALAVAQAVSGFAGASRRSPRLLALVRPAACGQFLAVATAFGCLTWAMVHTDLTVEYVAENSNALVPLLYKFTGVWGAHAGSLLLWTFILSVWGVAVAAFSRRLPAVFAGRVLAVMGVIGIGFLAFTIWLSNPFARALPPPASGADLNPILQSPLLAIHPPMLYMGYVGFSVAFAFAIAALIGGRMDTAWARWTRPWTLVAWLFLTAGITIGSFWSYLELGWGGWWFWDPVENASFMPWLAGTALIHSLVVTEKRGAFKGWTALLAIFVFSLSLLGTFLVRSGVLVSVHAFAVDPRRGIYVLALLGIALFGGLALYAWRAPRFVGGGGFAFLSRETLILANNVILVVACAAVLLGTLYPLFFEVVGAGRISVGPPYFDKVFLPLMVPFFLLIGIAPSIRWRRGDRGELWRRLRWPLALAIALAIAVAAATWQGASALTIAGVALGLWVIVSAWAEVLRRMRQAPAGRRLHLSRGAWGMTLAHFGAGILVLGVTVSTTMSSYLDTSLRPGQSATVGGYRFDFVRDGSVAGPNYQGEQGTFRVSRNGEEVAMLRPESRVYKGGTPTSESAISWKPTHDIYIAMGQPIGDDAWSVRLQVRPFVRFIWFGGWLIAFGGLLALSDPRYRRREELRLPQGVGAETS